jgi:pimeloyl-ACP methyl ester carboxylesterase
MKRSFSNSLIHLYLPAMITEQRNIILQSRHNRPFLVDVFYENTGHKKPVVVFSHGFKGFKDWGPYNEIAAYFARQGFVYVKFNFSHNGTTIEHPVDFADLEAFGNDNITIELDDLGVVIDWIFSENFPVPVEEMDLSSLYLVGHSRGGGISILKAREDKRVKKLCTWASMSEVGKHWKNGELEKVKQDGVIYVPNARTGQMMPIKWQMYENYFTNLDRLYIPGAVKEISIPFLMIHGSKDETVPVEDAVEMQGWNKNSQLFLVEGSNHNFRAKHPWDSAWPLPHDCEVVLEETVKFFRS